jgi:hypothetical protein
VKVEDLPGAEESWEVCGHPAAWVRDEKQRPRLAYALIIADENGFVRASDIVLDRIPSNEALVEAIRHAAAAPSPPCTPARPTRLLIDSTLVARYDALADTLRSWGIQAAVGEADAARAAARALGDMASRDVPSWLSDTPDHDIIAFARAGGSFLQAMPWRHVKPDTLIEARVAEGKPLFVTLMGNGGTGEVGFVVHERLADARRARTATSPEAAIGSGMESTSRVPVEALHPVDADRLASIGMLPEGDEILLPARFEKRGQVRPRHDLRTHTLLLKALSSAVTNRVGAIKITIDGATVSLKWPVPVTLAGRE